MSWPDLQLNLLSEMTGIIITVFVVDQIIKWRNKKQWQHVKNMFIMLAENHSYKILMKWEKWLTEFGEVTDPIITEFIESTNRDYNNARKALRNTMCFKGYACSLRVFPKFFFDGSL